MKRMRGGRNVAGVVAFALAMSTPHAFGQALTESQGGTLVTSQPTTTAAAECEAESQTSAWGWSAMTYMCPDTTQVQQGLQMESRRYTAISNVLATRSDTTNSTITNTR